MKTLPARIETDRLVLRPWTTDDAEALGVAITESLDHLRPWMPWTAAEPVSLADRRNAWEMQSDGSYVQLIPEPGSDAGSEGTHEALMRRALATHSL